MISTVQPTYKATVSPLLAALLSNRLPTGPILEKKLGRPPIGPGLPQMSQNGIFRSYRLRRDGERPLSINASLLWEDKTTARVFANKLFQLVRRFSLFMTDNRVLILQLSFHPCDNCAARPVYRVSTANNEFELFAFYCAVKPSTCFAATSNWQHEVADLCKQMDASRLPKGILPKLTQMVS